MNNIMVISAAEEHIDAVCALSNEAFSVPWSEKSMREELQNPQAVMLVAISQGEVLGYLNAHYLLDEGDLNLIAVKREYRKMEIGSMLIEALFSDAKEKGVQSLILEVRESNAPAIGFYHAFGFVEIGRRKRYYQKPEEDALL